MVSLGRMQSMRAMADFLPSLESTMVLAGALTVAGQWRTFTAFPSILAIIVIKLTTRFGAGKSLCHRTNFHDINFYSW